MISDVNVGMATQFRAYTLFFSSLVLMESPGNNIEGTMAGHTMNIQIYQYIPAIPCCKEMLYKYEHRKQYK